MYLMVCAVLFFFFFFSSRRRHTRFDCDWSSDVCSSDLSLATVILLARSEMSPASRKMVFSPFRVGVVVTDDQDSSLIRHSQLQTGREEIGRASCRERV